MFRRQMFMLAGVVLYFAASALANDGDVLLNLPRWNELYSQEKYTEAEVLARQMYAAMTTPYGRARAMHLVSVSLIPQQRFEEGERLLRETLDAARNTDVARQELMGNIHDTHGLFLHELGRYEEAEKEYRQAVAILSRTAGPDSTLLARAGLARSAMQQGDLANAEREYGQLVSLVRKAVSLDDEQRYSQLNLNLLGWAQCAMEQGRFDLAEPRYRETLNTTAKRSTTPPRCATPNVGCERKTNGRTRFSGPPSSCSVRTNRDQSSLATHRLNLSAGVPLALGRTSHA